MIQPSDTFAARTRRLASEVQRVRDWSGGDPERLGRLADALVELTGHRLDGHEWAEAAPSAQEAVVVAAKTLARHGPVGPYTPLPDAVRSITALVHLATIQSAAGLHEGAGQTLEAALGLRSQLGHLDLDAALAPATVARALLVWARAGLAAGDPAAGNARAAAAASVPLEDGLLAVDVDVLVADARWAAGWPEPAVEHLLRAVERYDGLALDALREPSRSAPGVAERLGEPLFGLYSAAADRVMAIGAPGLGLTLRRRLIDVLGTLAVRSAPAQQLLLTALADLAGDLRSGGRDEDARDAAELAASIAGDDPLPAARARVPMGPRASWTALPAEEAFGVHTGAVPEPSGRLAAQRGPADRLEQQRRAEAAADREARAADAAAQAERRAAQAERDRAEQERLAAERAAAERAEAERTRARAEAERQAKQRRRAERIAEHQRLAEAERAEREAALRARVHDETDAERAEREELERLAAELAAETERAGSPEPTETPAPPPEPISPSEPPAESREQPVESPAPSVETPVPPVSPSEPPVERVESPVPAEELVPAGSAGGAQPEPPVESPVPTEDMASTGSASETPDEPPEAPAESVEPVEPPEAVEESLPTDPFSGTPEQPSSAEAPAADPLAEAREALVRATEGGDRRDVRSATEELVELLQARYEAEPDRYLDELLEGLDALAAARWQAGDWWGSRGPGKQAKALRKRHGR